MASNPTTPEEPAYVNPYQELADKAKTNMQAWNTENLAKTRQAEQAQQIGNQMGRKSSWQSLIDALMQKRKRRSVTDMAAQAAPMIDLNDLGGM